jgi:hypothetical protein
MGKPGAVEARDIDDYNIAQINKMRRELRLPEVIVKMRRCIAWGCNRPFRSIGRGHRMCASCRRQEDYADYQIGV